jgi:Zn-dependent protease
MGLIELLQPPFEFSKLIMALMLMVIVAVAITVHELAHALSAKVFGDDTAERAGRVSLNPLRHYDPVGSTLFLLFGFGWAKPVPVNPNLMRNPRLHGLLVSLWGPLSNILLATLLAVVLRLAPGLPSILALPLVLAVFMNLTLAFFNLVPFPPLDGSHMITYILPPRAANAYLRFMNQYGLILIILLLWQGQRFLGPLISGAANAATGHLIGSHALQQ